MTVDRARRMLIEAAEHLPDCQSEMREALTVAADTLTAAVALEAAAAMAGAGNAEVIKALTICGDENMEMPCWDRECPYRDHEDCQQSLARDALACILRLEEERK